MRAAARTCEAGQPQRSCFFRRGSALWAKREAARILITSPGRRCMLGKPIAAAR